MAEYENTSPWFITDQNSLYLDMLAIRPIPEEKDDIIYTIENRYNHRPDLLAYDLYGTPRLWWVFVQRNMSIIKDPIYDFAAGTQIQLPKKSNLKQFLGV